MKAELESLWDELRDCRILLSNKNRQLRACRYDYGQRYEISREVVKLNDKISYLERILTLLHYISGLRKGLSISNLMKYLQENMEHHEVLFLSTRDSRNTPDYLGDYDDLVDIVDAMMAHVDPGPLCEPLMNFVNP